MGTLSDWNLAACQVTLDGFRITGWADTDAVSIEPQAEASTAKVSADGSHVAISYMSNNLHVATLSLRRGTDAFRRLGTALQDQLAASEIGSVPALSFRVFDPVTGTEVTEDNTRLKTRPTLAFTQETADAEYQLWLPNPDLKLGPDIPTST